MSLVLNVEILGEFKRLTQATKGAGGDLTGLGQTASKISSGIGKAFAAIGIGLSFAAITRELKDMTEAAIEDRKSQELLANAMINTVGATEKQIGAAEKAISKLQIQTSVADDQLRPAYQKLFLSTQDVTKSNDLLALALDVSAGTGKGLDVVAQAMAKSLEGNDAALAKLIPSLKGSKTPLDDLAAAFGGAAEKAADTDPYKRMEIIFGEIQEQLGTALLPVLDDFAAWMSSPPGQKTLQEIADAATNVLKELVGVAKWAIANKDWLLPLVAGIGIFKTTIDGINAVKTSIDATTAAVGLFKTATAGTFLASLGIVGVGAAGSAAGGYFEAKALSERINIYSGGKRGQEAFEGFRGVGDILGVPRPSPSAPTNVTLNVNQPSATAADIIKKLDDYYRNTGRVNMR
jgi:hypothetical protein